jgi:hypothetical protein
MRRTTVRAILSEPLSFQTFIKLPFAAFSDEKGDSGFSRNPL